jgi:hypothetical protein
LFLLFSIFFFFSFFAPSLSAETQGFYFQGGKQDDVKSNPFVIGSYGNSAFNPQRLGAKALVRHEQVSNMFQNNTVFVVEMLRDILLLIGKLDKRVNCVLLLPDWKNCVE